MIENIGDNKTESENRKQKLENKKRKNKKQQD